MNLLEISSYFNNDVNIFLVENCIFIGSILAEQYALGMSKALSVRLIKRLTKYSGFYLKKWLGWGGDVEPLFILLQK